MSLLERIANAFRPPAPTIELVPPAGSDALHQAVRDIEPSTKSLSEKVERRVPGLPSVTDVIAGKPIRRDRR